MRTTLEKPQLLTAIDNTMGMETRLYKWKSCVAQIAEGDGWATIYSIQSDERGKGHATELLMILKQIYKDRQFGGSVALNPTMKHLYEKTGITEYGDDYEASDSQRATQEAERTTDLSDSKPEAAKELKDE